MATKKPIALYSGQLKELASTDSLFTDSGETTYAGTISAFVGTTAPSGTVTATYRWIQLGKVIRFFFWVKWVTAGTAITQFDFTLPSGLPAPYETTTFNATGDLMYKGAANLSGATNAINNSGSLGLVKTGVGAYKFQIAGASSSIKTAQGIIMYLSV